MGKRDIEAPGIGLGSQINEEHRLAIRSAKDAMEHAREAGALLLHAKSLLSHGQWLPWLKQHCEVAPRTAQEYMRVADNWDVIESKFKDDLQELTVGAALKSLPKSPKPIAPSTPNTRSPAYLAPDDPPHQVPTPHEEAPASTEAEQLRAEIKARDAQLREMSDQQQSMHDELTFLQKIETEGDKLAAALKEVKRLQELVRILEERNRGMQAKEAVAVKAARVATEKVARLEREIKKLRGDE